MMLAGAFAAIIGAWISGSDLIGVLISMLGGSAIGCPLAMVAVRYRADHMVTGLTANILALGLTSYLLRVAGGGRPIAIHLNPLDAWPIPGLADLPVIGPLLFVQPPLTYFALLGCLLLAIFLRHASWANSARHRRKSRSGLCVRGEPLRVRMLAVVACGAIAGLGGAVLSLQQVGTFTDGMTGGSGYLVLAALIVGRWNPWGAAAACLVFGAAEAFELRLQSFGVPVGSYIVQMAPYLIALAVLAGLGRSSRLPAAIGQPIRND